MTQFFGTMFELGSAPVLERSMRFNEARHRLVLSNLANADTPGYHRQDLNGDAFQRTLDRAIDGRRSEHPFRFDMDTHDHRPVSSRRGTLPGSRITMDSFEGPLRHDENNVSAEREMALLARNGGSYRTYAQLLKKEWSMLKSAIAERPGS